MITTTLSASTAIAVSEPVYSAHEQLALAGFLAGYTGLTSEAYALDLGSTRPGASSTACTCSMPAGRISSALPATWKLKAGPARR